MFGDRGMLGFSTIKLKMFKLFSKTLRVMSLVGTDTVLGRWYIIKLGLMSFLEYFHQNPNELREE